VVVDAAVVGAEPLPDALVVDTPSAGGWMEVVEGDDVILGLRPRNRNIPLISSRPPVISRTVPT